MIVLDTHVWVWYVSDPERLSIRAMKSLKTAADENAIFISSISAWEVALLVANNRLQLTMDVTDWIARSETLPFFQFVPVDNSIAVRSVNLPQPLHSDPADRIIIATSRTMGASLITKDQKILNYDHVKTIW